MTRSDEMPMLIREHLPIPEGYSLIPTAELDALRAALTPPTTAQDDVAMVDALANAVEDFLKTPYDLTASILKDRRTTLLSHLTALRAHRDAVIEELTKPIHNLALRTPQEVYDIMCARALKGK